MDTESTFDAEIAVRLRRLDASAAPAVPGFHYDTLLERHAAGVGRARRRRALAQGTAGALALALIAASIWRFQQVEEAAPVAAVARAPIGPAGAQPRIVRADTYFAVVALEDHIASLDDALNEARQLGGRAEVERLERTRAELVASYASVRYAEMVSANF